MVDIERSVRAVVVVVGGDRDLELCCLPAADALGHPLPDRVGVDAEDHVEVGRHDDLDVSTVTVVEGDCGHLHVVVHPVRIGVTVADGDAPLIPRGDEEPR